MCSGALVHVYIYIICLLKAHTAYAFELFITHVVAMCHAGRYSDTGRVPCAQCPVGVFQAQGNMSTFTQCPHGTVTLNAGSVTMQDCQGTLKSHNVVHLNTVSSVFTFLLALIALIALIALLARTRDTHQETNV